MLDHKLLQQLLSFTYFNKNIKIIIFSKNICKAERRLEFPVCNTHLAANSERESIKIVLPINDDRIFCVISRPEISDLLNNLLPSFSSPWQLSVFCFRDLPQFLFIIFSLYRSHICSCLYEQVHASPVFYILFFFFFFYWCLLQNDDGQGQSRTRCGMERNQSVSDAFIYYRCRRD